MKRSEMIKLMWDFIQKVECDYDIYMDKYDTENLLSKMEEQGMIPPERVRYTDLENGRTICSPECTWEEE